MISKIFAISSLLIAAQISPLISPLAKQAQQEITATMKIVLNPETTNTIRELELQRLTTQLEMQKDLSRLAAMVPSVPNDPKLPLTTWHQVALLAAGSLQPQTMDSIVARLKHKDPVVQQMALQKLVEELEIPRTTQNAQTAETVAQTSFLVGDLSKLLELTYYRAQAVQPSLLANLKNTSQNREIAEQVTKELQEVLQQESKRPKLKQKK
ncbi:MAG: hypothetical protein J0L93_10320 [Deltaproteobacteria bacterium]|nr:hypothetical protein [Deltaproteobacteria bacterium]